MWEILIFKWFLSLKIQINSKKPGFGRKNQLLTSTRDWEGARENCEREWEERSSRIDEAFMSSKKAWESDCTSDQTVGSLSWSSYIPWMYKVVCESLSQLVVPVFLLQVKPSSPICLTSEESQSRSQSYARIPRPRKEPESRWTPARILRPRKEPEPKWTTSAAGAGALIGELFDLLTIIFRSECPSNHFAFLYSSS